MDTPLYSQSIIKVCRLSVGKTAPKKAKILVKRYFYAQNNRFTMRIFKP